MEFLVKKGLPLRWLEHKVPPPVFLLLCAAGMWLVADYTWTLAWPFWFRLSAALVLVVAGMIFDLGGLYAVRRARTTVIPWTPHRTTALVTGGVYRFTRNPMYLGLVFFLLAWSVVLAAPLALLGVGLFVLLINRLQIEPEERVMAAKFGEAFAGYAARVPRWL